jgi:integrase
LDYLRHAHVVHLIGDWIQQGEDVNRRVPSLSQHLGHANYADTWYYFHLVPEHFDWLHRITADGHGSQLPKVADHG